MAAGLKVQIEGSNGTSAPQTPEPAILLHQLDKERAPELGRLQERGYTGGTDKAGARNLLAQWLYSCFRTELHLRAAGLLAFDSGASPFSQADSRPLPADSSSRLRAAAAVRYSGAVAARLSDSSGSPGPLNISHSRQAVTQAMPASHPASTSLR